MDWKETAAKLAALGLPVLGKTVGTLVGGQIPIFGNMIEGAGENIGKAAADMIASALGVEPTPEAINSAIENRPTTQVIEALQAKEAEATEKWPAVAAAIKAQEEGRTERFKAGVADNADARETNVGLIKIGTPIAWAPVIISGIILIGYFGIFIVLLVGFSQGIKIDDAYERILIFMLGILQAAVIQVCNYWLGSSAGSAAKDSAMRDITATSVVAAATSTPAPSAKPAPLRSAR